MATTTSQKTYFKAKPNNLFEALLNPYFLILIGIPAHAVLGIVLREIPIANAAYTFGTLLFVGMVVMTSKRTEYTLYGLAYLSGLDVLWRMTASPMFHEGAKYIVALYAIVALIRTPAHKIRIPGPLVIFTFLMAVAGIFTALVVDPVEAREHVSGILSAHIMLVALCVYFFNIQVSAKYLGMIALFVVMPAAAIAGIATFDTLTADSIRFTTVSNFVTSGGFGPNQVSSALGAGMFMVVVWLIHTRQSLILSLFIAGVGLWLLGQGVLTFARGGTLGSLAASALILLLYVRSLQLNGSLFALIVALIVGINGVFLLNDYTDTALQNRYQFEEISDDARFELMRQEITIFFENPLIGVGVGLGRDYRELSIASHTEYTRILAEHGLLGLIAMLFMAVYVLRRLFGQPVPQMRILLLGCLAWAALYFTHAGTRTAMPMFMLALVTLHFVPDDSPERASKA